MDIQGWTQDNFVWYGTLVQIEFHFYFYIVVVRQLLKGTPFNINPANAFT